MGIKENQTIIQDVRNDDQTDVHPSRSRAAALISYFLRWVSNWLVVPFAFVENVCARLAHALRGWAFLQVLERVAHLGVLVAVISYVLHTDDRRRSDHYQAWQVINLTQGKTGNGGRIDAMQRLNTDKVSMRGIDVTRAFLDGVQLPGSRLEHARLDSTSLANANFRRADLSFAKLHKANIQCADFRGAYLGYADLAASHAQYAEFTRASMRRANLSNAFLFGAKLDGVNLFEADISDTNLQKATLEGARMDRIRAREAEMVGTRLRGAHIREADLADARLDGSDLSSVDLTDTDVAGVSLLGSDLSHANLDNLKNWRAIRSLYGANLYGVRNAPAGFIRWAVDTMGAVQVSRFEEWVELAERAIPVGMFDVTAFARFGPGHRNCQ
jgi:uncharacterized protein YjbI with pentapeptide repeats